MEFGAQVNCYRTTWDEIRSVIETMEAGRWNSLWFADHFVPPPGPRSDEPLPAYEAFSSISAAAGMTERLLLGHLVLGNTYRNPALVAKMAATIDQISGGRFVLGIGASWFEREHEAYGWEFPSMRERSDRFEEACALIRALFRADGPVDFDGRYYRLDEAPLSPGCVQEPHVPILVGGTGEQRTLRTLARYGDALNLDGWAGAGMSLDLYEHKVEVLNRHCEDAGRDPAEIRHTILVPTLLSTDRALVDKFIGRVGPGTVAGDSRYIVDRVTEFVDAGVDEIMFGSPPKPADEYARFDDEVLAAFD